jgi:hypothetical protein
MSLISFTSIQDGTTAVASQVNNPLTTIYNEFNGNISAANLATGAVTTAKIADANVTSAKLVDAFFRGRKKEVSTDSSVTGLSVQHGWGYIEGDGTSSLITNSITFPTAFSAAPVIICTPLGADTSGAPTSITEFTTSVNTTISAQVSGVTATDFDLRLNRATGTYGSGNYFGFTWIAIGTVA